jgi:hypothetical protein
VGPKAGDDGDHTDEGVATSGVVRDMMSSPDDKSLRSDDVAIG